MFSEPPQRDYNMRLGRLKARFHGSMQTEFNDNINLVEHNPSSDVYFFPNLGIGLQFPINPRNTLQLDLGLGYRAYVNHPELDALTITPDSRLIYQLRIAKVNILLRDNFNISVDPLSRPDVNGTGGGLLNFRRISNDIGLQSEWQARHNLSVVTSYDYVIDRSLTDQFQALDADNHNFAIGAFSNLGPSWNVGVNNAVTLTEFQQHVQNDSMSYTVGPQVSVKVTRFITVDANVGYTQSTFDQTGTVADRSDFAGISYGLAVRHNLNTHFSHSARVARSISPGFGSNFNDLTTAQYGLNWKAASFLNINSTLSYEHLASSGASGERAERYLWYVGTGWQPARKWSVGLGYSFAWKDSDKPLRDYQQHRVTVDLTRSF